MNLTQPLFAGDYTKHWCPLHNDHELKSFVVHNGILDAIFYQRKYLIWLGHFV